MTNYIAPPGNQPPSPPPPHMPAPAYGSPPASAPGTNPMAILALVSAFIVPPLGIVIGVIGRGQIRKTGQGGRGMATAGIVLGIIFTLTWVGFWVLIAVLGSSSATASVAQSSVESQISDQLSANGQVRPQAVNCASDLPAKVGASVHCTVNTAGKQIPFTATVTTMDGNTANFTVTPDNPSAPAATNAPAAAAPTTAAPTVPATSGIAACKLLNIKSLSAWTVTDGSSDSACTIVSPIGAAFSMYLAPTGGNNAAALSGAKGACDAGTLQPLQIANGGYVCMIGGTPSGGAVYNGDNTIVAISGVGVDGVTPGETQSSLAVLMKSFVAR